MRLVLASLLLAASMTSSGCALVVDASRNVCWSIFKPIEEHREKARNRQWAEAAWCQVGAPSPYVTYSDDYAQGFKDGYAEFLFRGGDGEPPLAAPLHYRHLRYQTPQGFQAIQDWFAGYRHGAAIARESGLRQWITGAALPRSVLHPEAVASVTLAGAREEAPVRPEFLPPERLENMSPVAPRPVPELPIVPQSVHSPIELPAPVPVVVPLGPPERDLPRIGKLRLVPDPLPPARLPLGAPEGELPRIGKLRLVPDPLLSGAARPGPVEPMPVTQPPAPERIHTDRGSKPVQQPSVASPALVRPIFAPLPIPVPEPDDDYPEPPPK